MTMRSPSTTTSVYSPTTVEPGHASRLSPRLMPPRSSSVVGSGPAGLALAWELARRGVRVRVYERDERPGGLLTYGIPNMKLPEEVVQRRIDLMRDSGVEFACGTDAAQMAGKILSASDAVVLAVGSSVARDMPIEGRELDGIHLALDYLGEVTRALLEGRDATIDAAGKDVVVIGGGDTCRRRLRCLRLAPGREERAPGHSRAAALGRG